MLKERALILRTTLLVLFLFSFSGCNLGFFNFLNFVMAGPGNGAAVDTEITQTEADLFEGGPVEMPVTIAKFDAPDPSKISIDVEPVGSPDVGVPFASDGALYRLTITGAPGAIGSVVATPYVVAYLISDFEVDTASQVIADVADDGSFVLQITMTLEQQFMYAAMAPDQESASPFTIIAADQEVYFDEATGIFIFITTNTNYLNTAQGVFSDASGYTYLSLAKPDGTRTFLRRNIRSTVLQTIEENTDASVDHVSAISENKIASIISSGEVRLTLPTTEPAAALVKAPMDNITTYDLVLDTLDPYDPDLTKLEMTGDERAVIITNLSGESSVKYYRTTSDYKLNLVPEGVYDELVTAMGTDADTFFVFAGSTGDYSLYQLDLAGSLGRAWTEKITLAENENYESLTTASVSADGASLIYEATEAGTSNLYLWNESSGLTLFRSNGGEAETIFNPQFNDAGTILIACRLGENGDGNQFVYHRIGVEADGEFKRLTANPLYTHCNESPGSFAIDASDFLHLYRAKADGSFPQHALISLGGLL